MAARNNDNELLLQIVRDQADRVESNHKEVMTEIKELRKEVNAKIAPIEDKVKKHEHVLSTAATITKVALPSGGLLAVLISWLTSLSGHAQGK